MKKFLFALMGLLSISLIATSCDKEENILEVQAHESNQTTIYTPVEENASIITAPYINEVRANIKSIYKWKELADMAHLSRGNFDDSSNDFRDIENSFNEVKTELLPAAKEFSQELQLTESDFLEMLQVDSLNQDQLDDAMVGVLLYATTTDECIFLVYDEKMMVTTQILIDCFIEATGFGGGLAFVRTLTKGTISKQSLKLLVKMTAKISGRTLSGIGLALVAGEMALCLWGNDIFDVQQPIP